MNQLPEISREDIAANFLFNTRYGSSIPRWKFELGLKLTKCEDPLLQQKAELIFRDNIPQWKVEMAAQCSEGWRLEHLERVLSKSVGELFMGAKREELWRMRLVAPLECEWQVKMVFFAPEVWKAEMIARLKPDQEMRARELLECSTE